MSIADLVDGFENDSWDGLERRRTICPHCSAIEQRPVYWLWQLIGKPGLLATILATLATTMITTAACSTIHTNQQFAAHSAIDEKLHKDTTDSMKAVVDSVRQLQLDSVRTTQSVVDLTKVVDELKARKH